MSEAATNKKTPIYKVLYFQVICAIVIGIVLGAVWPEVGENEAFRRWLHSFN